MQVLEEDDQRLALALANQQALDHIERLLSALGRIESIPRGVARRDREQPQHRGQIGLQGSIEGQGLPGNLLTNPAGVVPRLDLEVGPEQLDDSREPRGLAIGRRSGREPETALGMDGRHDLPGQP